MYIMLTYLQVQVDANNLTIEAKRLLEKNEPDIVRVREVCRAGEVLVLEHVRHVARLNRGLRRGRRPVVRARVNHDREQAEAVGGRQHDSLA